MTTPPRIALVRSVPATFDRALVAEPRASAIDVALARRQHLGYRAALATYGFEVHALPSDDRYPDSVFVEDTVVIVGPTALVTRPGADERRGEVNRVEEFVKDHLETLGPVEAPGTLDGGDVLQVAGRLFVGRSARSNDAGIARLAEVAAARGVSVTVVDVDRALHLKSVVTAIDDATLVVAEDAVSLDAFGGFGIVPVPAGERSAANVLRLGRGRVLMADGYPGTAERIERAGVEVVTVDISEFIKADGGLTCLSVLLPPPA